MRTLLLLLTLTLVANAQAGSWCNEFKVGYLRGYCLRDGATCLPPPVMCPIYDFNLDPYMLGVKQGLVDRKQSR